MPQRAVRVLVAHHHGSDSMIRQETHELKLRVRKRRPFSQRPDYGPRLVVVGQWTAIATRHMEIHSRLRLPQHTVSEYPIRCDDDGLAGSEILLVESSGEKGRCVEPGVPE